MVDQKAYNRQLIEDFRANRGTPGGPFEGRPLLLLTTTGAKTGAPHTAPVMYVPIDDRLLVIASNAGAPVHPDWYHNLVTHPEVTVEMGADTFDATAEVIEEPERELLWTQIVERYPFFADHQQKITRQIPVVDLKRR